MTSHTLSNYPANTTCAILGATQRGSSGEGEVEAVPEAGQVQRRGATPMAKEKLQGAGKLEALGGLPDNEQKLDKLFDMLRDDFAIASQMMGVTLSAAAILIALAAILAAVGLSVLTIPLGPGSTVGLKIFFPQSAGTAFLMAGDAVMSTLLVGIFVVYPARRLIYRQRWFAEQTVDFALAGVEKKQAIIRDAVRMEEGERSGLAQRGLLGSTLILALAAAFAFFTLLIHMPAKPH